jgi:SAM-dependent methyltransferase
MKLYNELAEYYFAIENKTRDFKNDINFIQSFIPNEKFASLLDLGCGSGEHLDYFSKNGYNCTGLDSSQVMLDLALKRNGQNIDYIHADMVHFDYFEKFDLIFSLFGSFNYILKNEDIDATLWNIRKAIKPKGRIILEIWNAEPLLKIKERKLNHVSTTIYNGTKIDRQRGFSIIEETPHTTVKVFYKYKIFGNSDLRSLSDNHIMRVYKENELDKFIENNGLIIEKKFSNSRKENFHKDSNKQLLVLKRK